MLSRAELVQLERSYRSGKALSVYLDGTSHNPAERTAWRRELTRSIAEVRETLRGAPRAEREAFDRCVAAMEESLSAFPGALHARGWVGFFPEQGEIHTEALLASVPKVVAWGDGIRVAPYIRALEQLQPAVIAIVDARSARLYQYADGDLEAGEVLRAHAHVGPMEHMGHPPRQGYHTGTRGSVGADAAARELEAGTTAMLRELADRLVQLAGKEAWILLGGIPSVAHDATTFLPDSIARRVRQLQGLDVHATHAQIIKTAERGAIEARREEERARVTDLLEKHAAGGRGIVGVAPTLEALHEHAVEALYFTANFATSHADDAELLVRSAFEQNVQAECVAGPAAERLDAAAGGVAASLRFIPVRAQPQLAGHSEK